MPSVARTGRISGSTIAVKIRHSEAPSISAASNSSSGNWLMNCRIRKTACELASVGTISPQ